MKEKQSKLNFKMITPQRVLLEEDVYSVTIPTLMGLVTILPDHIALAANLMPGEIIVHHTKDEKESKPLVVSGGIMEVANNQLVVLADTAEHVHELDLQRAEKAVELAQKLINEQNFHQQTYEDLLYILEKNKVRAGAFRKWQK